MAAALFSASPEAFSPEGCEKLAAGIGCDLERYRLGVRHVRGDLAPWPRALSRGPYWVIANQAEFQELSR